MIITGNGRMPAITGRSHPRLLSCSLSMLLFKRESPPENSQPDPAQVGKDTPKAEQQHRFWMDAAGMSEMHQLPRVVCARIAGAQAA
jgi:hypothetical protein